MPLSKAFDDLDLDKAFDSFMAVRDQLLLVLEGMRKEKVIGKSLEASVLIQLPESMKLDLDKLNISLTQVLMVSSVAFEIGDELHVSATVAEGIKCERCWNIVNHVNEHHVCDRCHHVLEEDDYEYFTCK